MRRGEGLLVLACVVVAQAIGCNGGCSLADSKSAYFGKTSRGGKDPKTFYVNAGSEPEYLDPGMSHDTGSEALVVSLFEGLAEYGPDAEPVPAVASSWDESVDHRLFRFHLRPDAKWSDGKQVTAHDFEYAWKRVLTPENASQAASSLYVVKNGEAFNLGKLKSASADTPILARPDGGGAAGNLKKGTPVDLLARSPMRVVSSVLPWPEAPSGKRVTFDKADPKGGAPEKLALDGTARELAGGWKDKDVLVVARLGKVSCNDEDDYFYQVESEGKTAVLPGCALTDSVAKQKFALVAEHTDLPAYKTGPREEIPEGKPLGFVDETALESDPSVVGVRATDDVTLEVELKDPTPYFIDLACHSTLYPVPREVVETWEKKGQPDLWTRPENIVNNGPYTLDTWKFRYEITMKKNPYYYDRDKLKIDRIVWVEVEDYTSTMNLYQAGDIDYIGDALALPPDYIKLLSSKKDFQRSDYLGTYWYELNTKTPPTDNILVRRALDLAIDKQQMVDKVVLGGQTPATHFVPDFTGLGYADLVKEKQAAGKDEFQSPDLTYNPEKARELLTEAGYKVVPDGDGYRAEGFPQLEVLYNTSEGHKKIAVAIQDQWKRNLGVSVALRNEEWKVMLKNVRDRNFQVVRFGWIADFNHAQTFLDTFLSYSPNNRTGWASAQFDALMKQAASEADPKASNQLYREAEKLAVDGMAKLPIYFYTKQTLLKPYVKGFHFNKRNVQLVKYMWIDPDWEQNQNNDIAYPIEAFPPRGAF